MEHPRAVDMNLVNAQQARRILDRLVGYRLSPFISQKIRRGLSAGRVQSVAVRMIVDREEEIRAFKPGGILDDRCKVHRPSRKVFSASLYGDENGKIKIENKRAVGRYSQPSRRRFVYRQDPQKGHEEEEPRAALYHLHPQQEASRKLGFQTQKTMRTAQEPL